MWKLYKFYFFTELWNGKNGLGKFIQIYSTFLVLENRMKISELKLKLSGNFGKILNLKYQKKSRVILSSNFFVKLRKSALHFFQKNFTISNPCLDLFEIHCGKNNFCGNLNFPAKKI